MGPTSVSSRPNTGGRSLWPRSRPALGLPVLLAAAVALATCGEEGGGESVRARGAPKLATKDLPRALARNVAQANVIIDGPGDLLQARLKRLRGFPVVVNQWASWCDPCRFEFPFFQAAARRHRAEVAFLGIDMRDGKDDARKFLEEIKAPFPSIFDPDGAYISSLGGGQASPTTVFIDRRGEVVNMHPGAYASLDALEQDIEQFARPRRRE
jgi:cytochrome c biogenesis protein CcmG, thiol:disulfide interchange protein DsbE